MDKQHLFTRKIALCLMLSLSLLFTGCARLEKVKESIPFLQGEESYLKIDRADLDFVVANQFGISYQVNDEELTGLPEYSIVQEDGEVLLTLRNTETIFHGALLQIEEDRYRFSYQNIDYLICPEEEAFVLEETGEGVVMDVEQRDGEWFVSAKDIASFLNWEYTYVSDKRNLKLETEDDIEQLPSSYDMRSTGQQSIIKDQADSNYCWAYALSTTLETSLKPTENVILSPEHVVFNNSFGIDPEEGGNDLMSMGYLLSWQGPVLEGENEIAYHAQEIRYYMDTDVETIKRFLYRYGGVNASIYLDENVSIEDSGWYNNETNSYCSTISSYSNHEITIIGWDDHFAASNFSPMAEGDGAFLCQNSWGDSFADDGVFYVSYYDSCITDEAMAVSALESADNYDLIYQTDLCGAVGTIGYEDEEAWFANIYQADEDIDIRAAGFYAMSRDTEYTVYVQTDYRDEIDLDQAKLVASGTLEDEGYYTISFAKSIEALEGDSFAIIVKVITPDSDMPIAIEYEVADVATVDLSDGEGYFSYDGKDWTSAEKEQQCNVCLKVYADSQ